MKNSVGVPPRESIPNKEKNETGWAFFTPLVSLFSYITGFSDRQRGKFKPFSLDALLILDVPKAVDKLVILCVFLSLGRPKVADEGRILCPLNLGNDPGERRAVQCQRDGHIQSSRA